MGGFAPMKRGVDMPQLLPEVNEANDGPSDSGTKGEGG